MDAYSVSCGSPAQRSSSRIYQDLKSSLYFNATEMRHDHAAASTGSVSAPIPEMSNIEEARAHIGIIGAGLAGLRCADILLQHGFRVTVIEGRNRVGGRLHQERLPNDHLIDAGPNWIHGTNDNCILDLAKQTNTVTSNWDSHSYAFDEDGHLFSAEDGDRYSTMMWDIIQAAFEHSNKHSSETDPNESLLGFFEKEVVKRLPDTGSDFEKERRIMLQMAELWGAFVGSPIERQSLKFFWLEECIEGENLFCAGTYHKILNLIAKPALEGASIMYNTTMKRLEARDASRDKVKVLTTAGQTIEFDQIVVTTPLGWLQKNLDAFDPPLPARLCTAIQSIGYGCLEKVYISFPKAFWLVPDDEGRTVSGFCQWLSPNYDMKSNPKRWTQELVELGSLPPSVAHPTLLFYIYGDESRFLTEAVAKISDQAKRGGFLYDFFRPYYSRLPHYDADSPDCRPVACFATDWLHDDLAGNGSYSNFQVGLQEGDEDIRLMRNGLPDCGLWFAGEHTATSVALGTATGAYWSGESVGRRIAEVYAAR